MVREVVRRRPVGTDEAAKITAKQKARALATILFRFTEWAPIYQASKVNGKKQKDLAEEMRDYIREHGEPEEKGHRYLKFPEPIVVGGVTYIGARAQLSSTSVLDEDTATEILQAKGLLERATKTITIIDQDEIFALYQEENEKGESLIGDSDLARMFKTTEKWSFIPDVATDPVIDDAA